MTHPTVVISHDLSLGVMVGALLSSLLFARHVGKLVTIETHAPAPGKLVYVVRGQLLGRLATFDRPGADLALGH